MNALTLHFKNATKGTPLILIACLWLIFSCSAQNQEENGNDIEESTEASNEEQATQNTPAEFYHIEGQIEGISPDTSAYLVEYRAQNQYIADTSDIKDDGSFEFKDDNPLGPGMYFVAVDEQPHIDLIIDHEQEFSFNTSVGNTHEAISFEGSEDNDLYYEYLDFIRDRRSTANELQEEFQQTTDEDEQERIREELQSIDEEVRSFQKEFAEENSHSFISDFIKLTLDPEVPDDIDPQSEEAYHYYKDNYFNHVNFGDERFVRTPVIHDKVETYFEQLVPNHPDSVIKAADNLIEEAKGTDEMFRYLVHYITQTYEQSDIMGMDAVFVHMAMNYYKTGDAFWVSETQRESIVERAETLEPLLIGKEAPDIAMRTLQSGNTALSDFEDASYTIVYFWDYDCGTCQRLTPDLYDTYLEYRDEGVEVFAVCTQGNMEKWQEYIEDNELYEWTNGIDPFQESNFRDKYDIYSTPQIYIVDDSREIVAKQIGIQQVPEVLDNLLQDDTALQDDIEEEG